MRPQPTASSDIAPRHKSFEPDEFGDLQSLVSHRPLSFQKPTLIYVAPVNKETDRRRSSLRSIESTGTVFEYPELDFQTSRSQDRSKAQSELFLTSGEIPRRKLVVVNGSSSDDEDDDGEPRALHQSTNRSSVRPGPGQVFVPADSDTSGTVEGNGKLVTRKPVPGYLTG